jgi:type I restriction enzyme M protein
MTEAEFAETMRGLHSEFSQLNAEAMKLQAEIDKNMKELFGED